MAVFRVEKNRNYTVMSNYHLRDQSLSLKAKGLMSMILSLPDGWHYSTRGLAVISGRTVRNAKKALGDRLKSRRVGTQWICRLIQPASEVANGKDLCRLPDGFCQMEMQPDYSDPKQRLAKAAEIMGLNFVDITDQCKPNGE